MPGSNKALESFLVESDENLQQLERDLVELERRPDDLERLASAFRAMHTIKGTCGFFGFPHLERVSHAMEDVLVALRDQTLRLDLNIASALLEGVDAVRALLASIAAEGNDGEDARDALIQRLQGVFSAVPNVPSASQSAASGATAANTSDASTSSEASIRVDVGLLDKLMNVVGELVLARNQLLQYASSQADTQLINLSQRLNLVTSELQEGLMKTRMQPISHAWSTYPRLVRDLEQQTGKKVRLEQHGGDTELDRSLLQAIRDPLLHLVRNAVDHGIETPEKRLQKGKPETGVLRLSAYHESGNVIIEVSDDGAGIRRDTIVARALERGLIRADQADQLSEREVLWLMFLPGFSTAQKVSNISGRGVGLDVVRNNVERIGGSIDLQTEQDVGTVLKIKIPLTLAIIPALIVGCRHERFAVPQVNLLEVVHIEADTVTHEVETIHDVLVHRLRGKLLPLLDLRQVLQMGERDLGQEDIFILVLQADGQIFGLIVDSVRDTEEIVVKPLGKLLRDTQCFAGATIMGDGRVALIVDVRATAEHANLVDHDRRNQITSAAVSEEVQEQDKQSLLIIKMHSKRGRAAIALSEVARLEEFASSAIELSAGREVVQYRDCILPLVRLDDVLGFPPIEGGDTLQVVVQSGDTGDIGLVVGEIVDIVQEDLSSIKAQSESPGILGAAIIQGHITDLIDMQAVKKKLASGGHTQFTRAVETKHE